MNLIRRFGAAMAVAFGASDPVSDESGWFVRHTGGAPTRAGVKIDYNRAMQIPAVFAAIGVVADAVGQTPCVLYRTTEDGREPATDHPAYKLLKRAPNPEMGAMTFKSLLQGHACGMGNAYAEIQRTNGGRPVALWPMLPNVTAPYRASDRRLRYRSAVEGTGERIDLPADDVLHIPALSFNGLVGYSPITQIRESLGLTEAVAQFGQDFFKNDAKSGGFLLHPAKLTPTAKKNIVDSVMDQRRRGMIKDGEALKQAPGGRSGGDAGLSEAESHRIKVLEEGMKFVPTTISPEDSQFLATREFQIGEIARAFRVPLILLQSHSKDSSWGTGVEQVMIGFVVWTIAPWLVRWEEELNRKLLTEAELDAGYFFKFNTNALLRGDMKARAEFYRSGIEAGWLTRQQAREFEDFNRIAGLDRPLVPLNHATVEPDGSIKNHNQPEGTRAFATDPEQEAAAREIDEILEEPK